MTAHALSVTLVANEMMLWSQRALTASGVPLGCAQAAARMAVLAQLCTGVGLALLRDELAAGALDSQLDVCLQPDPRAAVIEGAATSTLLTGPCALDLAAARAHETGLGYVWVKNARAFAFLHELVARGARRGLATLAFTHGIATEPDPLGPNRAVLGLPNQAFPIVQELALDSAPAAYARLVTGPAYPPPMADLLEMSRVPHAGASPPPGYVILCTSEPLDAPPHDPAIAARCQDAYLNGSLIDEAIWFELTAIADRVLVPDTPESEQSRRHLLGLP